MVRICLPSGLRRKCSADLLFQVRGTSSSAGTKAADLENQVRATLALTLCAS
jgi:hypothetical protein